MNWLEGVTELDLMVEQPGRQASSHKFSAAMAPEFFSCTAPNCEGGGLNVRSSVRFTHEGANYFYCQGFVVDGVQRSPCTTRFKLAVMRHAPTGASTNTT